MIQKQKKARPCCAKNPPLPSCCSSFACVLLVFLVFSVSITCSFLLTGTRALQGEQEEKMGDGEMHNPG